MKKLIIFLVFCLSIIKVSAHTTEASKFAEEQYAKQIGNEKVKINVKKEHTVEYQQKVGEQSVPAITYGYGDMRAYKGRKVRISYLVLLDEECKPFCSFIVPSK